MPSDNSRLSAAKKAKNDEFYPRHVAPHVGPVRISGWSGRKLPAKLL